MALADQHSHQSVKHGNAPSVSTSIHRAHGDYHAKVATQPAATPDEVHQYHNEEKYAAHAHAPSHVPVHAGHHAIHHAPVYHAKPVHHAPVYHPAPVHHAPIHHAPIHHAPVHHAPVYHPAPVHKPAPVYHPAPVVHKPVHHAAPYHAPAHHAEPAHDGPAVYQFGYAVADDYSGASFAANENRDGYATAGEYRVALPDGRTQIVTYSVGDAYTGYVADVKYEGEAHYPEYKPAHPAPAYKPAPYHA